MSTYVIGDVQGCFSELKTLLNEISFNKKNDKLIFAGDVINKGPDSLKTINFIMSLGSSAKIVLGNHEILFLAVSLGYIESNNKHTFTDILTAPNLKEIQTWLCRQKLMISIDNNIITHSGLPHVWSPKRAKLCAKEVERMLQDEYLREPLLSNIFRNDSCTWNKNLEGVSRWLCILNYFTRMRMIDIDGKLDLKFSSSPESSTSEFFPWFKLRNEKVSSDTNIIFGHWSAIKGITNNMYNIALDTGCVFGNSLTCYCLEDKQKYSIKVSKKYRNI